MTDAYSFTVEAEATWKVTNPEAVVRANLSDGNEVVLAWLKDEFWGIGRDHEPEDAAGAEISLDGPHRYGYLTAQGLRFHAGHPPRVAIHARHRDMASLP